MDVVNKMGIIVVEYMDGIVNWCFDFYVIIGILMIYVEFIEFFNDLGVKFILELKFLFVEMFFDGYS